MGGQKAQPKVTIYFMNSEIRVGQEIVDCGQENLI